LKRSPAIFIVHGHDESTKLSLKNYLQNTLRLGEPIILHEKSSQGRTIIEKFESYADRADIVFAILTPDDIGGSASDPNRVKRRARQNVIFELGFFYAKMQRTSGRVILLHKGQLELPSDISGIVYVDISNGIEAAGEEIRRELQEWLAHES
jgi:predicted nucleotide-binding protein